MKVGDQAAVVPDPICANERCKSGRPPLSRGPVGRPATYCSERCQQADWARRARAKRKKAAPGRDEWYAPVDVVDEVKRFYDITLDVAASPESTLVPGNWLGPRHPDPARRDGLRADWKALAAGGVAWNNCPFSKTARFVEKAFSEAARGLTVVGLVPRRGTPVWWNRWVDRPGVEVYRTPGRLRMRGPHSTGAPAPFDMVVVVWDGTAGLVEPPASLPKSSIFGLRPRAATFDPFGDLVRLLNSDDEDVRAFARAEYARSCELQGLPAPRWTSNAGEGDGSGE